MSRLFVRPRSFAISARIATWLCYTGIMADYEVILRLDRRYPFCIDQLAADGSRLTVERWSSAALAADRLLDIRDEEAEAVRKRHAAAITFC
jgi:hypothetical protein